MGSWKSKADTMENNTVESDEESFHDALDESNATEMNVQHNFQTDAVKSRGLNILNPIITCETMRDIESELTFYEKVSLAFLIIEQEDIALQSLLVEKNNLKQQTTIHFLYKWSLSDSSWKKKIIEGLCIIQNYSILERLGYDKEELKSLHLPCSPYAASNINILNKALYCFAESLTIDQIKVFLNLLEKDFMKKGLHFIKFDEIFVEMYLLQCFSVKYIDKNNISNLIGILKRMDLSQQIEMLETVYRSTVRDNAICDTTVENELKKNISVLKHCDNVSTTTESSLECNVTSNTSIKYTNEKNYKIDPNNVGICLIINQYNFYEDKNDPDSILMPEKKLENRNGTEFDRDKLKDIFTKFNFRVIIEENLTSKEIKNCIRDIMKRFTPKDSCFVVCILSHGDLDCVFGVNSIPVNITELEDILHDTKYFALLGKPKILIIQSCQGKPLLEAVTIKHNYVTDGGSSNNSAVSSNESNKIQVKNQSIAQKLDLFLFSSTVPGFASVRDSEQGTWFIQELCNVLEKDSDESHFEDMMTTVTYNVSKKRWYKDNKIYTMVPQKQITFTKKLYLTKIHK